MATPLASGVGAFFTNSLMLKNGLNPSLRERDQVTPPSVEVLRLSALQDQPPKLVVT